jgi:hypothetical protein
MTVFKLFKHKGFGVKSGTEFDAWLGVPGKTVSQGRYWWYLPRDGRSQVRPDAVKNVIDFASSPSSEVWS